MLNNCSRCNSTVKLKVTLNINLVKVQTSLENTNVRNQVNIISNRHEYQNKNRTSKKNTK